MKWFEIKERSAGEKRLLLTFYIYKLLGKHPVNFIAFFVTLFTYFSSPDLRHFSAKYLRKAGIKPLKINIFKHFLNYALAQADKIEIFAGDYDISKICLKDDFEKFYNCIHSSKGAVCIFPHVGNIDVMRALLEKDKVNVSIFLSSEQAKIFRNFLDKISVNKNITTYSVENTGVETAIELKNKIDKGELVFLAGDRISKNTAARKVEVKILEKKVDLPFGPFKFAELLGADVFFISALKFGEKYNVYIKEFQTFDKCALKMAENFGGFISQQINLAPFQFYHFYDVFKDC